MADKKKKVRSVKDTPRHKVGVVLGTGFFVILCAIIVFPVFAGLLASFRPGKELIRRGLSIDLDFSTMSLDNYTYLFSGNADYHMEYDRETSRPSGQKKLRSVRLFLFIRII